MLQSIVDPLAFVSTHRAQRPKVDLMNSGSGGARIFPKRCAKVQYRHYLRSKFNPGFIFAEPKANFSDI